MLNVLHHDLDDENGSHVGLIPDDMLNLEARNVEAHRPEAGTRWQIP
jgi:hypothetical protein